MTQEIVVVGRPGQSQPPPVRVYVDDDDRHTRAVLDALAAEGRTVEVLDARHDDDAARFLQTLVCCGPVAPVVVVDGLVLTRPTAAQAIDAVRRHATRHGTASAPPHGDSRTTSRGSLSSRRPLYDG